MMDDEIVLTDVGAIVRVVTSDARDAVHRVVRHELEYTYPNASPDVLALAIELVTLLRVRTAETGRLSYTYATHVSSLVADALRPSSPHVTHSPMLHLTLEPNDIKRHMMEAHGISMPSTYSHTYVQTQLASRGYDVNALDDETMRWVLSHELLTH